MDDIVDITADANNTIPKITEERVRELYEAERNQRLVAETLQETGLVLGFSLDTSVILDSILEQVAKVVPYDTACVLLIENQQARVARIKGSDTENSPISSHSDQVFYSINQTPNLRWIVENGAPLVIADTEEYPGWVDIAGCERVRAWVGVPIQARGELLALFSLGKYEPNFFKSEHIKQLSAFAGQTGLALQNASLFETIQRRAREAEMLRQAAAAVITELDLDHVLDRILIHLKKVVSFDNAQIFLLDDDQLRVVAAIGISNEQKSSGIVIPADNPLFRHSLTTGRPIILTDSTKVQDLHEWVESEKVLNWLGVPLHLRGRAIGFLTVTSNEAEAYTESEATLVQAFANEVTIALENARLFRELQNLATTDSLTEIWNRRHFIHLAKIEFQRARRFHQPLSVILFDIDNFKAVNDTYGHPVGDQVLRGMARICRDNLRQVDLFGRYGGEEFMALLPNTTISAARLAAERLRKIIAQTPMQSDRGPIFISASFGVAEIDDSCVDIDTLLLHADRAAYAAKFEGKNRVSIRNEEQDLSF